MRKIDCNESGEKTRIMLTNFSVTLDLRARMSDNCSVDNYTALDVFFLLTDFREVELKSGKKARICATDVWYFFSYSISAGKNNDRIFHTAC